MTQDAWFSDLDPGAATDEGAAAVRDGRADEPADWPAEAVASGFVPDEAAYYDRLYEAAVATARAETERRERAADRQLAHAVRAMDERGSFYELKEFLFLFPGSLKHYPRRPRSV